MTPDQLIDRADRILRATANLQQNLKYLIAEAKQLQKDVAEVNQMSLWAEDEDAEDG